jgi:hypothetical protein
MVQYSLVEIEGVTSPARCETCGWDGEDPDIPLWVDVCEKNCTSGFICFNCSTCSECGIDIFDELEGSENPDDLSYLTRLC